MAKLSSQILDYNTSPSEKRRRDLLPNWIKFFTWMFMIFGVLTPLVFLLGILGSTFNMSLYGLQTMYVYSPLGIALLLLYVFKGIVAYSLWTERDWAVMLALIDGAIGIVICFIISFVLPFYTDGWNIRLELVALVPYFMTMMKISVEWQRIPKDAH